MGCCGSVPSRKLPRPARNGSALPRSRIRVVSLLYLAAMSLSRSLWERWPSGRRRTPAKGVGIKSPSRVRIPPSPPFTHCRSSLRLDRAAWDFRLGRDFARSRITKKDRAPIDPFSVAEAEALIAALHRDWAKRKVTMMSFGSSPACGPPSRSHCSSPLRSQRGHRESHQVACVGPRQGSDENER